MTRKEFQFRVPERALGVKAEFISYYRPAIADVEEMKGGMKPISVEKVNDKIILKSSFS